MQNTIFFSNFAPIRFSTSYHNKAICRRTLILRALFGGLFCYFNRKAIYNGNVVTWANVPRLLATSFDNNWHFVLIFLPVQKHLFYLSSKHLTMNWLNKAAHVFQTTFGWKVNILYQIVQIFPPLFHIALSFSILFIYLCWPLIVLLIKHYISYIERLRLFLFLYHRTS